MNKLESGAKKKASFTPKKKKMLIIGISFTIVIIVLAILFYSYRKKINNQKVIDLVSSLIESGEIKKVENQINNLLGDGYYSRAINTSKSLLNNYIVEFYNQFDEYLSAVANGNAKRAYEKSTWSYKEHPKYSESEFLAKFRDKQLKIQSIIFGNSKYQINSEKKFNLDHEEIIVLVNYKLENSPSIKTRHVKTFKINMSVDKYRGIIFDKIHTEALEFFRQEDNEMAIKTLSLLLEEGSNPDEAYSFYREYQGDKFYYKNFEEIKQIFQEIIHRSNTDSNKLELARSSIKLNGIPGEAKGDVYTFNLIVQNTSPFFRIESNICINFIGYQNQSGKRYRAEVCKRIDLNPGERMIISKKIDDNRFRRNDALNQIFDGLLGNLLGNTVGKLATVKVQSIEDVAHRNLRITALDL